MRAVPGLLALLCLIPVSARAQDSGTSLAPSYSAASIVNSATNLYGSLAPNTIATLYGERLSYETRAVTAHDIQDGRLPTALGMAAVRVLVNGIPAHLYYVSPKQVNFLIPSNLRPGQVEVVLVRAGLHGPRARIRLSSSAPALYQLDATTAIATRPDGSVATGEVPARPGDIVILYATGLGETSPRASPGELVRYPAQIDAVEDFRILLDGEAIGPDHLFYAGLTPGFAGLYQINLRIPETADAWPEVRVVIGEECSPAGIRLPVER